MWSLFSSFTNFSYSNMKCYIIGFLLIYHWLLSSDYHLMMKRDSLPEVVHLRALLQPLLLDLCHFGVSREVSTFQTLFIISFVELFHHRGSNGLFYKLQTILTTLFSFLFLKASPPKYLNLICPGHLHLLQVMFLQAASWIQHSLVCGFMTASTGYFSSALLFDHCFSLSRCFSNSLIRSSSASRLAGLCFSPVIYSVTSFQQELPFTTWGNPFLPYESLFRNLESLPKYSTQNFARMLTSFSN